jgi:hypothetical protein
MGIIPPSWRKCASGLCSPHAAGNLRRRVSLPRGLDSPGLRELREPALLGGQGRARGVSRRGGRGQVSPGAGLPGRADALRAREPLPLDGGFARLPAARGLRLGRPPGGLLRLRAGGHGAHVFPGARRARPGARAALLLVPHVRAGAAFRVQPLHGANFSRRSREGLGARGSCSAACSSAAWCGSS